MVLPAGWNSSKLTKILSAFPAGPREATRESTVKGWERPKKVRMIYILAKNGGNVEYKITHQRKRRNLRVN